MWEDILYLARDQHAVMLHEVRALEEYKQGPYPLEREHDAKSISYPREI